MSIRSEVSLINFASPSTTFPKFSQLLDSDAYRSSVLLGLAASVGGLTESLVSRSRCYGNAIRIRRLIIPLFVGEAFSCGTDGLRRWVKSRRYTVQTYL